MLASEFNGSTRMGQSVDISCWIANDAVIFLRELLLATKNKLGRLGKMR